MARVTFRIVKPNGTVAVRKRPKGPRPGAIPKGRRGGGRR